MIRTLNPQLFDHIPERAAGIVSGWLEGSPVHIRITRSRSSKTGDYRPPSGKNGIHRITVNHDLESHAFLITLVHEIAHMLVFIRHGRRVKPHGMEWKDQFSLLMAQLLDGGVFAGPVEAAVRRHFSNPKATAVHDLELTRLIAAPERNGEIFLADLPESTAFRIQNGRTFLKKEKLRKRYRCVEVSTRRAYLFSPAARVIPIDLA